LTSRLARLAGGFALLLSALGAQAAPAYTPVTSVPVDVGQTGMTLARDDAGLLYGVSNTSLANPFGTVYRVGADGLVTLLHVFSGYDGAGPNTPLARGADGWFYGATFGGGSGNRGVIFKVSPAGEFALVHTFGADADRGLGAPRAQLVADGAGGWYGIGEIGPDRTNVLFQLGADGSVALLDSFVGPKLGKNVLDLVRTADGTLVGTTALGPQGSFDGALFSWRPGGRLHTVRAFDSAAEGGSPGGALAIGRDGAVYGTLATSATGFGSLWRLGRGGAFNVIHAFGPNDRLGAVPGGLTTNASGFLYGSTAGGGKYGGGTVYSMSITGTGHLLHDFVSFFTDFDACKSDGCFPAGAPAWLPDGTLWGTTQQGGDSNFGVFYRIVPKP